MKGLFSRPVCARRQTNGPPCIDQGFSYRQLQRRKTDSKWGCPVASHFGSVVEPMGKEWKLMMVVSSSGPEGGGEGGGGKWEHEA